MLFLNHEDTLIAIVGTNLLEDLTRLLSEEETELNKITIKFIELTVLYFNFFQLYKRYQQNKWKKVYTKINIYIVGKKLNLWERLSYRLLQFMFSVL